MTTSEGDLMTLLANGENQRVEFKAAVVPPAELARHIAGMANALGGTVLFGVGEDLGRGAVRGVDPSRVKLIVQRALDLIEPRPQVDIETFRTDEKDVVLVRVSPSKVAPVLARGVAYIRDGARTVPANANRLLARVDRDESSAELLRLLERFGGAIEQQSKMIERLEADSHWRQKLLWTVIGAVIGALIGLIPLLFQH